jgi:tetratricopeptide (TPR) repeat protein
MSSRSALVPRMARSRALVLLLGCLVAGFALAQEAPNACGSLNNHYGPYDYRTERTGRLRVVETYHFTPEVEALVRGRSSAYIGDDLSYTLRTSPNHHRALMSIIRYGERTKSPQPPNLEFSIDCYFDRAIRFQPNDNVVRSLFAHYLGKTGRKNEAVQQLEVASQHAGDNALSRYNIGLIYVELKEYDRALVQAHEAIRLGYLRPELPDMLKGVGKWQDAPPVAAEPAAAASAASAAQ